MEATLTGLLCPSCENPMAFTEVTHSYRCHACNPISVNVPICKTQICKQPLTKLGDPWNCWICLRCNKHPEEVNKMRKETEKPERNYIAKQMTEERVKEMMMTASDVRNIVIEAMSEFSTKEESDPDYPPTRAEIRQIAESVTIVDAYEETYLQKAKRLGVPTHHPKGSGMRKKTEVLADIERKEREDETNQQSSDQGTAHEDGKNLGGEPERAGGQGELSVRTGSGSVSETQAETQT